MTNGRKVWIDVLKTIAILAVLVDHTGGRLYQNEIIKDLSYLSVPLFVMVAGFNQYFSEKKHSEEKFFKEYWRKIKGLLFAYVLGTFLLHVLTKKALYVEDFLISLITFSASPPYYYVFCFLQFLLCSRVIYILIMKNKNSKINIITLAVAFFIISILLRFKTFVLTDLYGSGHHLFGGCLLFCFFTGMILAMLLEEKKPSKNTTKIITIVSIFGLVIWVVFSSIRMEMFEIFWEKSGLGFCSGQPVLYQIEAVLVFLMFWGLHRIAILKDMLLINDIGKVMGGLGKYTDYIFIFHFWIRDWIILENKWTDRFVCFFMMIFIPIIIKKILMWLKNKMWRSWIK